jgi:hypothetical protein
VQDFVGMRSSINKTMVHPVGNWKIMPGIDTP